MTVSDEDLKDIIPMDRSLRTTVIRPNKFGDDPVYRYYIRTFPMTVGELFKIIVNEDDEAEDPWLTTLPHNTKAWINYLASQNMDYVKNTKIFIRYIGMVDGNKSAHERFVEDLQGRQAGLLKRFFEVLEQPQFRHIISNAKCYELPSATFYLPVGQVIAGMRTIPHFSFSCKLTHKWVDTREQSLIALFDMDYTLNRQVSDTILSIRLSILFSEMISNLLTSGWRVLWNDRT